MNTLDDLRLTLDRHAGEVADTPVQVRTDEVRRRVGVVRRRRQGLVVAAVAVVVAAVSTGLVAGGGTTPQPAEPDRRLGGFTAPATIESLGWTYDYVTGAAGPKIAEVHVDVSDEPRLVTWATSSGAVKLAEESPGEDARVFTSSRTTFDDFTILEPGSEATFTAYADDVALAVYELSDDAAPPPGDSAHGITFRDQPAGAGRIASVIGEPGAADVSTGVRQPEGGLRLSMVCAGAPGGYQHLSVNGEEVMFGPGCDDPTFDPAGRGGITLGRDPEVAPGDDLLLRMWVTDGRHGPLLDSDELQLALGAYELEPPHDRVAGADVPSFVEHDGHVWSVSVVSSQSAGPPEITATTPNGVPTLAQLYWRGSGDASVVPTRNGRPTGARFATGNGSTTITGTFLTDGSEVGGRVEGDTGPDLALAVVLYERVD